MGNITTKSSRRVTWLATAALLAVAAVGCSSSDETASPSVDKATTSTTTSAAATTTAPAGLDRYAGYKTINYAEASHWVCRPDVDDICDSDLDSTTVEADGTLTVEKFTPAEKPAVDCFYVYPTISRDTTKNSDWDASPDEEGFVTLNQAARLQSQCRLFAPVYRQNTLTSLTSSLSGSASNTDEPTVDPYDDVLDAFRTYMAQDNGGRGFVLVGHSQGAALLNQLIQKEIDPNEDVRSHLVSAYLAGWSVGVPAGQKVGGDFQNVPTCSTTDETGCVVSWVSFRADAPPPADSFFGRSGGRTSTNSDPAKQAVCVNPAALSGGDSPLASYFPANRTASILGDLAASIDPSADDGWVPATVGAITTPFVSVPGLVSGSCESRDGFNFLSVTVHPDPSGIRADDIPGDLTPQWGLHLVDINLVMGDVVGLVKKQAEAYAG